MFKSSAKKAERLQLNSNLTFIGCGCKITGDIHCEGNLRIDGSITGNVTVLGDVDISADGIVIGDVLAAKNVIVHGRVKAKIEAQGLLRIHKNSVVEGDVSSISLDIENGARFVGHSNTGAAPTELTETETPQL
ncbi:MAG: polymer-forming cytoskeletal protein [Sulfuriferula sp.]|nr:polymer-forming cytoskeletal protein [Sulfuriferula sp.]